MAGRYYKVMLLRVGFKYELEHAVYEIPKIHRAINRSWCHPAMHSKRMVGFVVLTQETSDQLMDRLRPILEGITSIENYWCHTILPDVVSRHGNMDPLTAYVREAWEELRKRNQSNDVGKPERAEPLVVGYMQDLDRSTAIKMGIKGRRVGKPSKDSDRKES